MIDIEKLKALAEVATEGKWTTDGEKIVMSAESDQLNAGYAILECHGPEALKNAKLIAAANPAAVLELIAEIERLTEDRERIRGQRMSYASKYEETLEERDQLKAENEALSEYVRIADQVLTERNKLLDLFECPAHGRCVPHAIEQVEALRKDAERYRWLRGNDDWCDHRIISGRDEVGNQSGEILDGRVDAAIAQEHQS